MKKADTYIIQVHGQKSPEVMKALFSEGIRVSSAIAPMNSMDISIVVMPGDEEKTIDFLRYKYGRQSVVTVPVMRITILDDRNFTLQETLKGLDRAIFFMSDQYIYLEVDEEE